MNKNEITFERMPEAIATILSEVSKIRDLVEKDRKPTEKRKPMDIDEVCALVKKAKPTIYALARKGHIPCSKTHGKLYFFEDQLISWIDAGKRKTTAELKAEIEAETKTNKTKRPTRRY
ncbi:MAG: helix-turn-helix domain-containing protein [Paludibacter sp.]|nr:helix-turn-helix domain-containing protein [Paludibacter sp.]